MGKMTGRISGFSKDVRGLGRWTYTKYQGREGRKLIVMTAYRVSQQSLTPGDNTAYNQQYRTLRRQGVDQPKPKKTFCADLLPLIQK